jgi:hypothetical protein
MAVNWWFVAALAVILTGCTVLICAAHIPWLRELTGAAPLERDEDGHL